MTTPWYIQPIEMSIGIAGVIAVIWVGKAAGLDSSTIAVVAGTIAGGTFSLLQGRGGSRSTDPQRPPTLVVPASEPTKDDEDEEKP